jgi:nicotinamide mononucleotide transporter
MNDVLEWLHANHLDGIQCAVLILGVTEVLLARANKVALYPAGIAATILAIYSLFTVQLYAECLLHVYYLVMSVYGWCYWASKPNHKPIPVTFCNPKEWAVTFSIAFGGWMLLFFFLVQFTPSEVPLWDAWISSTGWAGMWLLARRKVENWVVLNVSNAFAIPLLIQKQLPLFAVLTAFLFVIACIGYVDWTKLARKNLATSPECNA